MTVSRDVLDRLAGFDTPTICNAIELFEVRPRNRGYMDARIKCSFPELPPMVGFAATACFRSDAPPKGGGVYASLQDQLEQFAELPGPAVVVFQDLDDPPAAATFGEVMCSTYMAFGAEGLITSGAGRDLEQVRAIEFPVFTGSTICSHGYCHLFDLGATVRVGGLVVGNGDLLHGDANGVTDIPIDIADELADVTAEFLKAEEDLMAYVKSDDAKTIAGFAEVRREFTDFVTKLRQRVSRKAV